MHQIDFFIGDVHGRSDLLAKLLTQLQRHARSRGAQPRFTFLGDIVDRGSDPRGSMELVCRALDKFPGSAMVLGNHDHMMRDAIDSSGRSNLSGHWGLNGGLETVERYVGSLDIETFVSAMRGRHARHYALLRDAPAFVERGGLVAVHAGVDWTIPLDEQSLKTLTWVRDPFLDYVDPSARPVIHGHSVCGQRPVVTENRIAIDTGAVQNDRLTACIADPSTWEISFAQATPAGVRYIEPLAVDRGHGTLLDDPRRVFEKPSPAAVARASAPTPA
jgi:serine/threonine protein phosphatase 1